MPYETPAELQANAPASAPAAAFQRDLMQDGAAANAAGVERNFPITLAQSAVAVPVTGTTSETTLATITIPAGMIGANGQVEIIPLFSGIGTTSRTLRVRFGGTVMNALVVTTTTTAQPYVRIANRNSAASQVGMAAGTVGIASTASAINTAAIDTSAAVDITITGQLTLGSETITLESYVVRVLPKA